MAGTLCLSYDFELAWGCRANSTDPGYGRQYEATWQTVPRMLDVLESLAIPSTWAVVGALMLRGDYDFSVLRRHAPEYPWFQGPWYDVAAFGSAERRRYYAPELVEAILTCRVKQELATHTFTHVYASDPATSAELFDLELQACRDVAETWGVTFRSIVYPRNQVGHLAIAKKHGLRIFRSLNTEWYWFGHRFPTSLGNTSGISRIPALASALGRLVDERLAFTPPVFRLARCEGVTELMHSCFLPGYSGVSAFVSGRDRVRRVCKGIDAAIRKGRILSVYFHPHNFNNRRDECIETFRAICRYAARRRDEGVLEIVTMADLGDRDCGDETETAGPVHWAA